MRIAIIGDSFTYTYKDTWIQTLVETLNLKLIHQSGFPGHSEFRIYKEFKIIINSNNLPDVILICHTEHARLYNPTIPIKPSFSNNLKYDILNKKTDFIKIVNNYYEFLYDSEYSSVMHNFIIKDIQEICRDKNIKLINIPCFEHDFVEKNYGLWFLTNGGLIQCSKTDHIKTYNKSMEHNDLRLNHFSPNGHEIIANNIIPHIKTYINTDQNFHISLLFPELFA